MAVSHLCQVCGTLVGYHMSWLFPIYVKYVGLQQDNIRHGCFSIYVKYVGLQQDTICHDCFPSMSSMWDCSRILYTSLLFPIYVKYCSTIPYGMTVSHLCQISGIVVGYHTSWLFPIYVKYVGLQQDNIHHGCFPSMSSMWNCCRIPDVMVVSHLCQVCGTVVGYHTSWLFPIYVKHVGQQQDTNVYVLHSTNRIKI